MAKNKIKNRNYFGDVVLPCPACGCGIPFTELGVWVNAETSGVIEIEGMLVLNPLRTRNGICKNPFCKWSKVE